MARTLPLDLDVTDPQFDRVAAAMPGDTAPEKIAALQQIVRQAIRQYVINDEIRRAIEAHDEALDAARQAAVDNPDNI